MSVKISELPILDSLADNDVIAGVDTSANVTSKIEMATLKNYIDTNTQYTAGTNINITDNVISAPNVYNKTETDELLEEKDEQIEELQSEVDSLSTIFNAFPTESGEGESVTLDDTAEVKFKKFDLKGNTSQTTYSGKNLVKVTNGNSSRNNTTLTIQDNVINFKTTGDTTYVAYGIDDTIRNANYGNYVTWNNMTLPAGTYTLSTKYLSGSTTTTGIEGNFIKCIVYGRTVGSTDNVSTNLSRTLVTNSSNSNTFTTSQDMEVNIVIYMYANQTPTVNINFQVQLESGSSATDFEPYVGGTVSPNPSYPQPVNVVSGDNEINVCGKNLLDMSGSVTYQRTTVNFVGSEMIFNKTGQDGISASPRTQLIPYYANQGDIFTFSGTYLSGTINLDGSQDYRVYVYPVDLSGNTSDSYKHQINLSKSSTTPSASASYTLPYNIIGFKVGVYFPGATNTTTGNVKIGLQLEKNSSASTYEPYQGNTYNIDLGVENLWDTSKLQSGFLPQSGSYPTTNSSYPNARYRLVHLYKGQSITLSGVSFSGSGRVRYIDKDTNQVVGNMSYLDSAYYIATHTFGDGFYEGTITAKKDFIVGIMDLNNDVSGLIVNYGTTPQTISPNPIELCKIGNYQDYFYKDSGKWYLHKEIGKVVLDGSESWAKSSNTNVNRYYIPGTFIKTILNVSTIDLISDYFTCITPIQSDAYNIGLSKLNDTSIMANFSLSDTGFDTLEKFKTWLSSHNVVVYYVLATPTNTEITYQPLIDQLNLLEKAMSKDSQTNISQVNNDLGFIIYAEAIKSLQNVLDRIELLES